MPASYTVKKKGEASMTDVLGMNVKTSEREIVFTRTFDAPRQMVWDAWTKKEHLLKWWGPHQFTNSKCSIELRPGGKFLITMNGPDGKEYPCHFVFDEILPIEKLVWTEKIVESDVWGEAGPPPESKMTMLLEDAGSKTKMTIISRFSSNADRDKILAMGAAEGWAQSFERLELLLTKK